MSRAPRWKWNMREFERLRRTPQVKNDLRRVAGAIAADAGEGYEVRTSEGRTRSRSAVIAMSPQAMLDNARNNTLLRATKGRR